MNGLIEQNFAVFFPIFFMALWLTVTTLLALLSGWFELMARYPNRTVEPILRVRFQSGAVGRVPMRDILTLDVCSSGLRVGMMRALGPFCRAFFVPERVPIWCSCMEPQPTSDALILAGGGKDAALLGSDPRTSSQVAGKSTAAILLCRDRARSAALSI